MVYAYERIIAMCRKISRVLLVIVIVGILYLTVFRRLIPSVNTYPCYMYNFVPLKTIVGYIETINIGMINISTVVINILANIIMFIPVGFLFNFSFEKRLSFGKSLLICTLGIAVIELIQLCTRVGSFDVDDIILGIAGFIIGSLISITIIKKRRIRK